MLTLGSLNELSDIRHGFFTRTGGVSQGLYASLNCGYGSNDESDNVTENRRRAMARIGLDGGPLVTVYQIHSATVAIVDVPWAHEDSPRADALVTNQPGIALGILTADCVPVLLADGQAGVIGAAHAGWRGAQKGILEGVVEAMESLGAKRENISAGIGPAIAQRSYEVGPEFPEPFLAQSPEDDDLFCPAHRAEHFFFDLKGYVARHLHRMRVGSVMILPCDTYAEDSRFFSYRRSCHCDEKDYGRGLSAIYLEP